MGFKLSAACGCHKGYRRANNEDNLLFDGQFLNANNNGLQEIWAFTRPLKRRELFAVFDGMGGEQYGEIAAYEAARAVQRHQENAFDYFSSKERRVDRVFDCANLAVVEKTKELKTRHMGSTMALCVFFPRIVCVGNLGDSRVYRWRENRLEQISKDHVEKRRAGSEMKPPLTQHLGIDPMELRLEPHIVSFPIENEDCYLLCSDGITDMIQDTEIESILLSSKTPAECTERLISAALENGGKDNITAIVVFLNE